MIKKSLKEPIFLESYRILQLTYQQKHDFSHTHIALTIMPDSGNRREMHPGLSFKSFKNLKQDDFSPQLFKVEKAAAEALPYHTLVTKVEK